MPAKALADFFRTFDSKKYESSYQLEGIENAKGVKEYMKEKYPEITDYKFTKSQIFWGYQIWTPSKN